MVVVPFVVIAQARIQDERPPLVLHLGKDVETVLMILAKVFDDIVLGCGIREIINQLEPHILDVEVGEIRAEGE